MWDQRGNKESVCIGPSKPWYIFGFNLISTQHSGRDFSREIKRCFPIIFTIIVSFKINSFILIGVLFFYNTVIVFATHRHESAMVIHVSPYSEHPSHIPPHSISLGCPRALAFCALLHAYDLHWSSILHMIIYMFQCYSLKSSHPCLLPFTSVSLSLPCM